MLQVPWLLAALACLFWRFPLFHVVPLNQTLAAREQAAFNAAEFVKHFWAERLMKSLDRAADATEVVSLLAENPQAARQQFGRKVGLSEACYYFLRGNGTVISVSPRCIALSLSNSRTNADVIVPTGLLFGNAARDATGLLDASAFPNSQNFNDISSELNRLIETQVLPSLTSQAAVGRRVQFVGCAEVGDEDQNAKPLTLVPVWVKVE